MKKSHTLTRWALLIALTMPVLACSISPSPRQTEIVNLSSETITIRYVNVYQRAEIWHVWGEIQSLTHTKKLNGNVRISVIANNGEVLYQKDTAYKGRVENGRHHKTRHSNKAIFSVTFESIPENSRVVAQLIIVEKRK
ncbi:MAG: hypothetical protein ABNH21_05265 [Glaciecola sp.]|jgi:hypothetical protein